MYNMFNQDDFDIDAVMAAYSDDAVYDLDSSIGVGETRKGKKAISDWFREYKKEFPKRKFVVKNISFSAWPFCPRLVGMVEWSCMATNKDGKEYKFDGVSVNHIKNFKVVHGSDYISFAGLPKLSTLIKPVAKT
jgi:ketosteroid isomerase-like protein